MRLYIANAEGKPAATVATLRHGDDCEIWSVATEPEARGRGLGTALMRRALLDAAQARLRDLDAAGDQARRARSTSGSAIEDFGALQMWEFRPAELAGSARRGPPPDRPGAGADILPLVAGPQPDRGPYSEQRLEAAVERPERAERFARGRADRRSGRPAAAAGARLGACRGGWFGESHDAEALKAATTPDPDERISAVRTLLAEEARMGMMVGVAVGWALQEELRSRVGRRRTEGDS